LGVSDQDDRRRAPRVESIHLVNVDQLDAEGFHTDLAIGRTLDLSKLGMQLELNHLLPLRTTISLSLAIDDEVIDVQGRVVFARELDGERYAMGIEFQNLSDELAEKLSAFVTKQAAES
jgi:c-di-GMP-binding flagellar brake protein YcgR